MMNPYSDFPIPSHLQKRYKNSNFEKSLFEPFSSIQLQQLINYQANIFLYRELAQFNCIEPVLGPFRAAIILYEWKHLYGHWVTLFERPGTNILEFFDPYGYKPDDENEFIPPNFQSPRYLSELLYKASLSGYDIEYNQFHFQTKDSKDISTCGRWVALRLLLRHWSLEKFADFVFNVAKVPPDYLVTSITNRLLK